MKSALSTIVAAIIILSSSLPAFSAPLQLSMSKSSEQKMQKKKNEVVFHVSPKQFQKAAKIFAKNYPGWECEKWNYNFDGQEYMQVCKKDGAKESITLSLLMDGSMEVTGYDYTREDRYSLKKIGRWE
jgi:hypothetical protein